MIVQDASKQHRQPQQIPIAVIGMSALFPKARNLQEYWTNIINKTNCISAVPPSCWNVEDYYDPDPKTPDKTYSKHGGFIPSINFDPLEFGLPLDTLEATDSAQVLSLVMAKAALEDAGYSGLREFNRETTGVILGASGLWKAITPLTSRLQFPIWEKVLKSSGISDQDTQKIIEKIKLAHVPWRENSFPGILTNVIAGRITNRLDLGGTNCTVDAACASSLGAFKMAVSELTENRCDLMITGGIDTDNSILTYLCFSKTPAFSRKDFLNPFDADSDGMMVGEGIGMLVLKRLEDAERDGDRIYAVVQGIGTGSDGRYKSIYAPRPEGQIRALNRAYKDVDFSPSSISLMEAHGTGTPVGDFCEFTALNEVFSQNNPKKGHIALGSVKSQIGHTKAAAGAASLIKAILALYYKVLPATINITRPNPKFKIEDSPFYLNTEVKPWIQAEDMPRRAGVSSFGFGGTNYHVVLEEYGNGKSCTYRLHTVPQSVLLWTETPEQLVAQCEVVLLQLKSETGEQHYRELINSCRSSVVPTTAARVGFVAASLNETCELLQITINALKKQGQIKSWAHPRGIYYRKLGLSLQGRVVALFPGQGSQYVGMGREIAVNFPPLHEAFSHLDRLFIEENLTPLSQIVFPCTTFDNDQKAAQVETLQQTENAQSAIGAFSVGLYKILQQAGFKPDFVAGHSFGELTALWAAKVLSDRDYFYLAKARGQAMGALDESADCDRGTMLAVNGDVRKVQEIIWGLSRTSIANFNSPEQIVLSGSKPEIAAIQKILCKRGYAVTPLPVSAAFHTSFVSHASKPFADAIQSVTFNSPQIPVYSNTTGKPYIGSIQTVLQEHLLKPVQFEQQIENLYSRGGYCFVEIGPRQILTNLVKSILGDRPHLALALNPSREKDSDYQLRQAVMQLRVVGLPLQNLDPYQLESVPTETGKSDRFSLHLSGSNYISAETQFAFEKALQDGHQAASQMNKPVSTPAPASTPQSIPTSAEDANTDTAKNYPEAASPQPNSEVASDTLAFTSIAPLIEPKAMLQPTPQSPDSQPLESSSLEKLLTQLYQHQSEILRVHEQYLKYQAECSRSVFQLMQQNYAALTGKSTTLQIKEIVSESGPAHSHSVNLIAAPTTSVTQTQATSLISANPEIANAEPTYQHFSPQAIATETHTNSTNGQTLAQSAPTSVLKGAEKSVESRLSEAATTTATFSSEVQVVSSELLMQVISRQMGYPMEMLNPNMDPRLDLGINIAKWGDIIETMQTLIPDLPKIHPAELAEQLTIAQAVQYIQNWRLESHLSSQTTPSLSSSNASTPSNRVIQKAIPTEDNLILQSLLSVISDKTGYPAEMLEKEMDLEADLGIDSIKRVEIIGAMQELFPALPNLSPDELVEQRTLYQISEYLRLKTAGTEKKTLS